MMMWSVIDSRSGKPATVAAFGSKAHAELQILRWRTRQRRGGRPDVSYETCQALRAVPRGTASYVHR